MKCPSCHADIADAQAAFCARCGAALWPSGSQRTDRLGPADEARSPARGMELRARAAPTSVARAFGAGGWAEAVGAAAFCFLSILGIGSVLVVAAKLENPGLGADAGALDVLSAIVVLGLAGIGATLDLGRLSVDVLPLGVLVLFGWIVSWAARTVVGKRHVENASAAALEGMKLAVPLGLICFVAALIFRVGRSGDVLRADPVMAAFVASLWGALFGALGGMRSRGSLASRARNAIVRLESHGRPLHDGVIAGGAMLLATAVLSAAALLVIIIVGLMRGEPSAHLTAGDAASGLVYLAAFLPNLVVLVASFSLGANVEVGARVSLAGRPVGGLHSFSLLGWDGAVPGGAALLLLLFIPLAACLFGGFTARRNSFEGTGFPVVLGTAAVVYAGVLSLLGWLSSARIGVGVLGRGIGRLAPGADGAFVLALLWAGAAGWLGWKLGEASGSTRSPARRRGARTRGPR